MAEQIFKSPGFFEREIDLSGEVSEVTGVPAGIIGTARMGPAFIPVTLGTMSEFSSKFGSLDPKRFGPYAVNEFLKYRTAVTYIRVLGAGANSSKTDIENTRTTGAVRAAGFKIKPTAVSTLGPFDSRWNGAVQFLGARHTISASQESVGYPIFTDNDSIRNLSTDGALLIRGMLFTSTGSRFQIMDYSSQWTTEITDDFASVNQDIGKQEYQSFKLILSSTAGSGFSTDVSSVNGAGAGIRIYTASLDPRSDNYISKILNTDPSRFQEEEHLLYADFPVPADLAHIGTVGRSNAGSVVLMSGSGNSSSKSGVSSQTYLDAYGRFDTRYRCARTTSFISQPFGSLEYNLFHFETITDGTSGNHLFKVSIANIRKSDDINYPYPTFDVQIRQFGDSDSSSAILETYNACTLDPNSPDYIAAKIGDFKIYYDFDATSEDERRMVIEGLYPNASSRVRVVMDPAVRERKVPKTAAPFGFRGFPSLNTNSTLTDSTSDTLSLWGVGPGSGENRLSFIPTNAAWGIQSAMSGCILPPVPYRIKVTDGKVAPGGNFLGSPGEDERVNGNYYWGCQFEQLAPSSSYEGLSDTVSDSLLQPNAGGEINEIFVSYAKFFGMKEMDTLVTGSGADAFNNNKFTLARVALGNDIATDSTGRYSLDKTANTVITGSAKEHILETAYVRNGQPDPSTYTVSSDSKRTRRVTLASLYAMTSSIYFNRFSDFAKFTNFFYGGFDGVNILDSDMSLMNDKAASGETGGKASLSSPAVGTALDIGLNSSIIFGKATNNNIVASYRSAAKIMTDPMVSRVNILVIPGMRDSFITNDVMRRVKSYGKAFYIMDIPNYNSSGKRLFINDVAQPDVQKTYEKLTGRGLDNNFTATYFPDVFITDETNNQIVGVPSSIAAMGAIAFNDENKNVWFAPAGFGRGSLGFVNNVKVRLNQSDRDNLYLNRVNPIATFPGEGYVIFGQKTLQLRKSALDRVNVRRMLLEVKRIVTGIAQKLVFEPNNSQTRARFVATVVPELSNIQMNEGIEQFKVICDSTNNTSSDVIQNKMNGKIVLVPTRAIEFISIDFIITNGNVEFV